jgi:hypothetical protein
MENKLINRATMRIRANTLIRKRGRFSGEQKTQKEYYTRERAHLALNPTLPFPNEFLLLRTMAD